MFAQKNRVPRLWNKWITLGTRPYDGAIRKRLVTTNILATLVAVLTLPYTILYAFYDFHALLIPLLTLSPQIFLFLLTPFFHRFGPNAGPWYLVTVWLSFALLYTYYFGVDSGLQYFFLPGATGSILVFGVRNVTASLFAMIAGFIGFLIATNVFVTPASFLTVDDTFMTIMYVISLPSSFVVVFGIVYFAGVQTNLAEARLQEEYQRSEDLLYNVLPEAIANELKQQPGKTIARTHGAATILFADIVEFTPKASRLTASQIVELLNALFSEFDDLTRKHGLEKVKTIGDAFMAAGGLPLEQADHAERVGHLALDMICSVERFSGMAGERILLRIGINSGPVVAGVIGNQKLVYDVWGDTVNTAGRMETYCTPQRIQVTPAFKELTGDVFTFERRGEVKIKGLGQVETWYLTGRISEQAPQEDNTGPEVAQIA